MKETEVYELCPHCGLEAHLFRDIEADGYKAYCPNCGGRLMLCDECMHGHGKDCCGCDYDTDTDSCKHNPTKPEQKVNDMISEKIRKAREVQGISMRQAAIDMDFPYMTYVNYEKGVSEPNSKSLAKIAAYFKVSADYLIGTDEMKNEKKHLSYSTNLFIYSAIAKYNDAVKKLRKDYTTYNETKAYRKQEYLYGIRDCLKAQGYSVMFDYADNTFFSEIKGCNVGFNLRCISIKEVKT